MMTTQTTTLKGTWNRDDSMGNVGVHLLQQSVTSSISNIARVVDLELCEDRGTKYPATTNRCKEQFACVPDALHTHCTFNHTLIGGRAVDECHTTENDKSNGGNRSTNIPQNQILNGALNSGGFVMYSTPSSSVVSPLEILSRCAPGKQGTRVVAKRAHSSIPATRVEMSPLWRMAAYEPSEAVADKFYALVKR